MKKNLLIAVMMLVTVVAWSQSIKKSARLSEGEVPVAVRNSLEKDYNVKSGEGQWSVFYSVNSRDGGAASASPLWYTYTKAGSRKIEVRLLPDGRTKSAKGIDKRLPEKQESLAGDSQKPATK
jgi:hypothetical protein